MPLIDLQTLVEQNPTPFILDPEEEARAYSHKSLFGLPAHVQIAPEEPRDWERYERLSFQSFQFNLPISWLFANFREIYG